MNDGTEKKSGKLLVVMLAILCILIIAMVVLVVVNRTNDGQEGMEVEETESVLPEELRGDNLSPEDQVIKETTLMISDSSKNENDIEAYYDTKIKEALNDGKTDLATRIIIQKVGFIVVTEENCARAEEYVSSIDLSPYSADEKMYLASYILSMITGCGTQELQAQWEQLLNETVGD